MSIEENIRQAVREEMRGVVERLERLVARGVGDPDELLTPREAAALAKISQTTLREWRRVGALRDYGRPRAPRYKRSEVLAIKVASNPPTDAKQAAALIPLRRKRA